jgi:hypothetical protein
MIQADCSAVLSRSNDPPVRLHPSSFFSPFSERVGEKSGGDVKSMLIKKPYFHLI